MITVTALHAGRLSFRDRSPREGAVSNDVACKVCWEGPQDGPVRPVAVGTAGHRGGAGGIRFRSCSRGLTTTCRLSGSGLIPNEWVLDARTRDALTTQRIAL